MRDAKVWSDHIEKYDIGVGKIAMLCDIVKSSVLYSMFFSSLV